MIVTHYSIDVRAGQTVYGSPSLTAPVVTEVEEDGELPWLGRMVDQDWNVVLTEGVIGYVYLPGKRISFQPAFAWKWGKWTFGFWHDVRQGTFFGIDIGPLEIVWRYEGER